VVSNIPPQAWARAALIPLVFFAGSLLMAAITAAIGVSSVGSMTDPTDPFAPVFNGGASWIVATFQLLGMGFFSPLSIGVDMVGFGGFSAAGSVFFVPWQVPIGGLLAVAITHRYLGKNLRTAHTGTRALLAGLAGLAFATVVTVLVSAIRFRFDTGIDEFGGRMWAHAASVPGFLVAALLVGGLTYVLFLPQRGLVLDRILTGLATVLEHVLVLALLAALALFVAALVQDEPEAAVFILFALPTVGFMAFSMLHFIPTVASGTDGLMGMAETESLTLFELPTAAWIIGLVVVALMIIVTALRWALRTRFYAHALWAWITLPATYLVIGVLLTAANGFYVSMFGAGEAFRFSVQSAVWGFLVWLLLGGVIQVLAAYGMPRLMYQLPAGLVRTLGVGLELPPAISGRTPTPPQPPMPDTVVFTAEETTAIQASASNESAAAHSTPEGWHSAGPTQYESRRMSRRTKVLFGTTLSLVVLLGLAWAAHAVLARTTFGPQHTAEAYLQAVVDGRAEDAVQALGPNVTDELRALATDDVYQAAEDRPDRFELGEVHRDGSTAVVEATLYQSGKAYPVELGLTEAGTQAVVFNDWALDSGDIAGRAVYLSGPSELTVNGVTTEIQPAGQAIADESDGGFAGEFEADVAELAAESGQVLLPGTYTFTAPDGSKYLSSGDDLTLTVTPGELSDTPIEFSQRYTEEFEQDVVAAVEQRLESCLADRTIRIDDCEAASWEDTAWEAMTDMTRTWDTPPEIEVVPVDTDDFFGTETDLTDYSGPVVARVTEGRINVTYEVRDDEDQDWMERERTYEPFYTGFYEPMEFPVTLDGEELTIDFSPLDEYNPDWLSPEFR
jgi:hypothetical protein